MEPGLPPGTYMPVTDLKIGDQIKIGETFAFGTVTKIGQSQYEPTLVKISFTPPPGVSVKPNWLTMRADERVFRAYSPVDRLVEAATM